MKRSILPMLGLLAGVLGIGSDTGAQSTLPDLIEKLKPSIVILETYTAQGVKLGTATGFFIHQDHLITTRHVIARAGNIAIVMNDGQRIFVTRLLAEDIEGDLVMLEAILDQKINGLTISTTEPRDGENIFVIGSPLGFELSTSEGILSGRARLGGSVEMLMIDAAISRGSSGSPVMNMKGEVIGIAAAKVPEGESLNFAIPASRLAHLVYQPLSFADWVKKQLLREIERENDVDNVVPEPAFPLKEQDSIRDAIVEILIFDDEDQQQRIQEGFFITPKRILTMRSSLQGAHRVMIRTLDGSELVIEGVAADDPLGDMVALQVRTSSSQSSTLEISGRRPYREEPLMIASFQEGANENLVSQIRISMTLTDLPKFGPVLSAGLLEKIRISGSPVLDDQGTVIAMVIDRTMPDGVYRYLVPTVRIRTHTFATIESFGAWNRRKETDSPGVQTPAMWDSIPYIMAEQWERAVAIIENTTPEPQRDVETWLALAICRNHMSDWSALIFAAERATALDPESSLGHFLLGLGYLGQVGRNPATALKHAQDSFRKAISLDPKYNYHSYIRLAATLGDFNEIEQGVGVMKKAIEQWPDRPETHDMLAAFYMHHSTQLLNDLQFGPGQKFRRLSMEEAAMTVKLAPYASWAYKQLAQSAALNEIPTLAIDAAKRAIELKPYDPLSYDILGRIYLLNGDRAAAMETYETLRELNPEAAAGLLKVIESR
ncbi:MAG: trypsin-like peptidase domain-containing protein [Planctomycetes bacterium]|nr:trypsin-like peptidase domain-containing protein [Planctomycetota bacterium]